MKDVLELRGLERNLAIIFIVLPNDKGNELTQKLFAKVEGATYALYSPITLKKLVNQLMHIEKNKS